MNIDVLIREIFTIVNTLSQQDIDSLSGDTLSRLAVKIASYKASLGEYVATATRASLDAEADYKLARAKSYQRLRDEGSNSTDAKETKEVYAYDALVAFNEAKELETKVKTLSKDCHDLIDGIKSRLINIQSERMENRVS